MQSFLICPSCNAFYKASDFKEDLINCSKCGRQIGKDASLIIKNEKEEIKRFLKSEEFIRISGQTGGTFKDIIGIVVAVLIIWGGTGYGMYYYYSKDMPFPWWLYICIIIMVSSPFTWIKQNKYAKEFKAFIEKNNYSIDKMYRAIRKVPKESVTYEGFYLMVNYIKAQNEIKEEYSLADKGIKVNTVENIASEVVVGEIENYLQAPDQCPTCNNFYKADEKQNEFIKCKKCGYTIRIANPASRQAIEAKMKKFISSIPTVKIQVQTTVTFSVLSLIVFIILFFRYKALGSIYELFVSPHIITIVFFGLFAYVSIEGLIIIPIKYFLLSRKKNLSLIEFEETIMNDKKRYLINPHTIDSFYAFKREVNALFINSNKVKQTN